ncbi:putative chitobiose transport system substrate-binding protein [Silvimonas terrae]|uniref:Putative chitobiose transport system substrate-binding protein n=1 Tax=Silvimonas terrae TaxID=300266 RepID=A0A840RC19_9NEIS|nr:sugar ABC transporter substrate-binding protein [Silvimonas terrae]MBB5190114.1 putative chitobiose transport system substrate-binding protein [Silvimonas terrae]
MKYKFLAVTLGALWLAASANAATEVEFWSNSLSPKFDGVMKQLTAEFNASHKDVQAKWVDVTWDTYQTRLIAAVAAGRQPGLINITVPWMTQLAQKKVIQPIDISSFSAAYTDGALKDVSWNGKTWGLPWYNQVPILIYNKTLLDKAGITTLPRNTDEILAVARQIKQKTGVAGYVPKMNEEGLFGTFLLEGLPIVQNGKAVFNSPQHVAVLEKYATAVKNGSVPPDLFKDTFEAEIAGFGSGRYAMILTAPSALMRIKNDAPRIFATTGVAPYPSKILPGNLFMWSIPQGYPQKDAAVELGKFLTSDKAQLAFSKATETTLPSTKVALTDSYFMSGQNSKDAASAGRAVAASTGGAARTLSVSDLPDEAGMTKALSTAMENAVSGRQPARAALDEAVKYWNAQFAAAAKKQ